MQYFCEAIPPAMRPNFVFTTDGYGTFNVRTNVGACRTQDMKKINTSSFQCSDAKHVCRILIQTEVMHNLKSVQRHTVHDPQRTLRYLDPQQIKTHKRLE